MQEHSIEKTYEELKHLRIKSLGMLALVLCLLTVVMSIFYGNPFSHKVTIAFFTYMEEGWITGKIHIWVFICILAFIIVRKWQRKYIQKVIQPYMELLTDECDALRFKKLIYIGLMHGNDNTKRSEQFAKFYFEWMYVLALNAREEHREMLDYLKQNWSSSKRKRLYDTLLIQAEMNVCSLDGDMNRYMELYQTLPKRLKKDPFCVAQMYWVQGDYESMMESIETVNTKTNFERVKLAFAKGRCYNRLNRIDESIGQFDYVIEHGNTLGCKQLAIEIKEKIM